MQQVLLPCWMLISNHLLGHSQTSLSFSILVFRSFHICFPACSNIFWNSDVSHPGQVNSVTFVSYLFTASQSLNEEVLDPVIDEELASSFSQVSGGELSQARELPVTIIFHCVQEQLIVSWINFIKGIELMRTHCIFLSVCLSVCLFYSSPNLQLTRTRWPISGNSP